MSIDSHLKVSRVLLVDANDMTKWVGSGIPFEVHVPPLGLMYLAAYARSVAPQVVRTLQSVGYGNSEITHMYSVLKRKIIHGVGELMPANLQ